MRVQDVQGQQASKDKRKLEAQLGGLDAEEKELRRLLKDPTQLYYMRR